MNLRLRPLLFAYSAFVVLLVLCLSLTASFTIGSANRQLDGELASSIAARDGETGRQRQAQHQQHDKCRIGKQQGAQTQIHPISPKTADTPAAGTQRANHFQSRQRYRLTPG
jgi:hypothetical protein